MRSRPDNSSSASWDPIAAWYSGWVGALGSRYHQRLAIPTLLQLLQPRPGDRILDLGCGPGVLAPHLDAAGATLVGIDLSPRLIAAARQLHGGIARFLVGDVTRLGAARVIEPGSFDGVTFLLSIQDIAPLEGALRSAAWALRNGGRLVLLMTHPCFRVPRQSGWGWDEKRALRFRRVDRYLSALEVPMQPYGPHRRESTRSYHRPLEAYVAALTANGLAIEAMREVAAGELEAGARPSRAQAMASREIPLFLGLRAIKQSRFSARQD